MFDDTQGHLILRDTGGSPITVGNINYGTGELNVTTNLVAPAYDIYGPIMSTADRQYTWNEWIELGHGSEVMLRRLWISSYGGSDPVDTAPLPTVDPTPPVTYPPAPPPTTVQLVWASAELTELRAKTFVAPNYTLKNASFKLGASRYVQLTDGTLLKDVSPSTGGGTPAGSVSGALGQVSIGLWETGASPTVSDWRGLIAPPSVGSEAPFTAFKSTFRTASSPLRPASVSVLGTMQDGTAFNVTADTAGKIDGTRVKGRVDYQYGLVELYFVNPAGNPALNVDLTFLGISGLSTTPADLVMLSTLRYNAVAYSYLPLDADLLGIDPVRLPSDGRVPIFRAGGFAVVGHTGKITATVNNAQTIDCARVRLSRVRVVGFDGSVINTGYTTDLEAGTVTFTAVAGYSQPVTIEHRIEDMAVVREAQISGEVTFTRALTHDYPLGSFLSSALVAGDLKSRVSVLFDQTTWTSVWQDSAIGSIATGTFNDVLAPIVVTNIGAVTERWALIFTNTTTYNVTGEHVGVIGTGTINADLTPINPATSQPYFTVPALGWGLGWATGNVLRFNTIGAMTPVWVVRTVQQGPNTGIEHSFTLLSRGDVDRI